MARLDGNAIAGQLVAAFGREMTAASVVCASCEARSRIGELFVYGPAPGAVARCGGCGSTVIVLVEVRGLTCVGLSVLELEG
jgi:hypothetical protein